MFIVRFGGVVGVVVKGLSEKDIIIFRYGFYLWVDFDDVVYFGFFFYMFMIIKSWFRLNLGRFWYNGGFIFKFKLYIYVVFFKKK